MELANRHRDRDNIRYGLSSEPGHQRKCKMKEIAPKKLHDFDFPFFLLPAAELLPFISRELSDMVVSA